MSKADELVTYARTQIGQKGQKYMDWMGYADPWCSEFVSYCANQCGFIKEGLMPKAGNCAQAQNFYKPKGLLHSKSGYSPKAGDIIFFGKYGTDHTAIVEQVIDTDIVVIEGNAGDTDFRKSRVCRTAYKSNNSWIWGFANPLTQEKRKQYNMIPALDKLYKAYAKGLNACPDGVEYVVPKRSTIMLITAHNSTPSLNSIWLISCANNKAFRISGASTVYVTVKDNDKVIISTKAGSPRTYWCILEK